MLACRRHDRCRIALLGNSALPAGSSKSRIYPPRAATDVTKCRDALAAARMSALGHKRTLRCVRVKSALPPKADIDERECSVRFVPKADIELVVKRAIPGSMTYK